MATYTYPNTRAFVPATAEWGLRPNVIVNTSRFNGSVERLELPGSRWVATLSYPEARALDADAAEREGFWSKISGPANLISLWHPLRPNPRGTMRGSPTITSAVAQGATVLPISTTAAATLQPADMISAGGMLFMVVTAAVANGGGSMSVSVSPPARLPILSGAAVTWDRPTALMMPTGEVRIPYRAGRVQSRITVDLVEVW
jgi:hypothetical protein